MATTKTNAILPLCLLIVFAVPRLAVGQLLTIAPTEPVSPVEPATPAEPPRPSVAERRAENAQQLRIATNKLETNGTSDTVAAQDVAYFQTRESVLAQLESVEQQIAALRTSKSELEVPANPKASEEKTYTFNDLDQLKDDLAAEESRANLTDDRLRIAKGSLQKAHVALDESEVKQRQARGAHEAGKETPNAAGLAAAAERAKQEAELAKETLLLRMREVEREQLSREVQRLSIQAHRDQIAAVSPHVVFTEAEYAQQIAEIKKKEESISRSLAKAQANLDRAEVSVRRAQQKLDAETGDKAVATEELETERRTRDRLSDEIDSLTQRLQYQAQLRVAWGRRYEIASTSREDTDHEVWSQLKKHHKETKGVLDDLESDLRTNILKMRDVRGSLTSVTKRADEAAKGPTEVLFQLKNQQMQLEERLRLFERNMVTIEASRRVHEKLLDEIGLTVESFSPKTIALGAWYHAELIWNKEILEIAKQSITLGMILKGLAILVIGWFAARFFSGVVANWFLRRFRLSKDATSVIRTLLFYCMLALVALTALNTVNVPLTAFTILGGALAIGVGFGSQALINNFISGLIMLAERPVRLGERVTFGNYDGIVEEVGFRCTKLRTLTDHLVTIPNSMLVNESIENIDRRRTIRRKMDITITYDTPRELVAEAVQTVRDILEEKGIRERIHPIVGLDEYPPRVFFNDFNAESLNIVVFYWYAPADRWAFMQHCEAVNFRIMEEFARLGVDFAFPSRTVYVKHDTKSNSGSGNSSGSHGVGDAFAA